MAMTPDEIERAVLAAYPAPFRRRLVLGAFAAFSGAWDFTIQRYARPEAENAVWGNRRAEFETNFRGAAELTPELTPGVKRIPKTAYNYTEVHAPGMMMVAKKVDAPGAMPDRADYRDAFAQQGNQDRLFDVDPAPTDAPMFVMATYTKYVPSTILDREEQEHLPGSLHIAVPSPDFTHYLWEWNLFKEFHSIVRDSLPQAWDNEAVLTFLRYSQAAPYRHGTGGAV